MKKLFVKKNLKLFIVLVILVDIAIQILGWYKLEYALPPQHTAERWRGDSQMPFGQISCFLALDEKVSVEQIYGFRNEVQKRYKEAAMDINGEQRIYIDAWSTNGKVKVNGRHGGGDVGVTAVGGNFFDFHPLRLISGSYINENDLMKDRVLLDEETAWMLFGGQQLTDLEFTINGRPFVVAGVVERETDRVSRKAYTGGMCIYMSYEAFMRLQEDEGTDPAVFISEPGVSCYEAVMAEPVKDFAYSIVQEKFPINNGIIVKNTDRFKFDNILKITRQYGLRSMQKTGVVLPYWENAARFAEDWCSVAVVNILLVSVYPWYLVISSVIRGGRSGKTKLSEDIIPDAKSRVKEAIRVRQRARWEKKHPGWDRNTRK